MGAAPAYQAATRRLNSAAPQLMTSSRSSGSLTGSATRAIGAQVDDPRAATAKIHGCVLCEDGARTAARRIASTVSGAR